MTQKISHTKRNAPLKVRLSVQASVYLALGALWGLPTTVSAQMQATYKGQCDRNNEVANVTLILNTKVGSSKITSGTLNGKSIFKIQLTESTIKFDTPGIYKDQDVIRHFEGSITDEGETINGKLRQDDGKAAKCELSFYSN